EQLFHSSKKNARKNEQDIKNLSVEKGLTQATLQLMLKKIDEFTDYFTIPEISEASQLSHVSVRKYVLFLEKNNLLES
ncbi:LytTR family transcriptional regulator, partial [Enterococcus faecalis]